MRGTQMCKSVHIIPFEPEHATYLASRSIEGIDPGEEDVLATAKRWSVSGPAFTATYLDSGEAFDVDKIEDVRGRIVGCGGLMLLWPGVGQGWVIIDKKVRESLRREAYTVVAAKIAELSFKYKLHRIQAVVRVDLPPALKYAANLGFKPEGVLRQYDSQKRDYMMFSMVGVS